MPKTLFIIPKLFFHNKALWNIIKYGSWKYSSNGQNLLKYASGVTKYDNIALQFGTDITKRDNSF